MANRHEMTGSKEPVQLETKRRTFVMPAAPDRQIPLDALSDHQRKRVEEHLPLVYLTLSRHAPHERECPGREYPDLRQEGYLALLHAVRKHDPTRHGPFGPYAMARIHYAVSRYAHENESAIRVPFITHRRRRQAWRNRQTDRHRPDPLPKVVNLRAERASPSDRIRRALYSDGLAETREAPTVSALIRDRFQVAARRALQAMLRQPGRSADRVRVIQRCFEDRWTIPDEEGRTPIRRIMRETGSSLGLITHCEARFRGLVSKALLDDPVFTMLRRMARCRPEGFRHRLTAADLARLRRAGLESIE